MRMLLLVSILTTQNISLAEDERVDLKPFIAKIKKEQEEFRKAIGELNMTHSDLGIAAAKSGRWSTSVLTPPDQNYLADRVLIKSLAIIDKWPLDNGVIIHIERGRAGTTVLRCVPPSGYKGKHRIWITGPDEAYIFNQLESTLMFVYGIKDTVSEGDEARETYNSYNYGLDE